jgi:hypothetical protein
MRIKSILPLLVCSLISGLTIPAIACPPPDCGACCHWEGPVPGGFCYLDLGADCGDCAGCSYCYSCVICWCQCTSECCQDSDCDGECYRCSNCSCVNDDDKCTGCESCVDGECEDDDDNCVSSGPCKSCVNAICEDDNTKCGSDECCDDGTCVDKCDPDGGATCTWTNPPVYDPICEIADPLMPFCINPDKTCDWEAISGPDYNATCADCAPGCTTSTYCVLLKPILCTEGLWPLPPFYMCRCIGEPSLYDPVPRGTRDVCP